MRGLLLNKIYKLIKLMGKSACVAKGPYCVKRSWNMKASRIWRSISVERAVFQSETDKFQARVADQPEEIKTLLREDFGYICGKVIAEPLVSAWVVMLIARR
jgi:hypothetical protein